MNKKNLNGIEKNDNRRHSTRATDTELIHSVMSGKLNEMDA